VPVQTWTQDVTNRDARTFTTTAAFGIGYTVQNMQIGSVGSKNPLWYCAHTRFDLTGLPAGVTITGVAIRYTTGAYQGGGFPVEGGFIKRDGVWDGASAFQGYPNSLTLPIGQRNSGSVSYPEVYVGDAPGFSNLTTMTQTVRGGEYGFGEGLPAYQDAPGLLAQFQAALDSQGDDPVVCFHWYRFGPGLMAEYWQSIAAANNTTFAHPAIEVEWTGGNEAPSVSITSPAGPIVVDDGEDVTLAGTATDAEDGDLSASIDWSSDLDGALGTGASIVVDSLSAGVTHEIEARVEDSGALVDTDTVSVRVNAIPTLAITAPADGAWAFAGESVTFEATVDDVEPEVGREDSIVWRSSIDGVLGAGTPLSIETLSDGTHTITAEFTDADGATGFSPPITITIREPARVCARPSLGPGLSATIYLERGATHRAVALRAVSALLDRAKRIRARITGRPAVDAEGKVE